MEASVVLLSCWPTTWKLPSLGYKSRDCSSSLFLPMTESVWFSHMSQVQTLESLVESPQSFCWWCVFIFEMFYSVEERNGYVFDDVDLPCLLLFFLLYSLVLVPPFVPRLFALSFCFCLDLRSQNRRPLCFFMFLFMFLFPLAFMNNHLSSYHESHAWVGEKKAKICVWNLFWCLVGKTVFLKHLSDQVHCIKTSFLLLFTSSLFSLFPVPSLLPLFFSFFCIISGGVLGPFSSGMRVSFLFLWFPLVTYFEISLVCLSNSSSQRINSRQVCLTWSNDYSTLYLAYYYGWRRVYIRPLGRL